MPTFEYEMPDGRKIPISAANETEADAKFSKQISPQPEGPSFWDRIKSTEKSVNDFLFPPGSADEQEVSGLMEGAARTLGAPVDLANSAIGLGMKGINKVFGTDLKPSEEPLGGSAGLLKSLRLAPESDDPGMKFDRRIMKSIGGSIPAAVATGGAGPALGVLTSGLTGGLGGATAEAAFPDSPLASTLGDLAGSAVGAGLFTKGSKLLQDSADRAFQAKAPSRIAMKDKAASLLESGSADEAGHLYGQVQKSKTLSDTIDQARQAADMKDGPTYATALKNEFKKLLTDITDNGGMGYTPGEIEAIKQVAKGNISGKVLRGIGAPGSMISGGIGGLLGYVLGGGPIGGAVGAAAAPAISAGARAGANRLASKAATAAEALTRSGVRPGASIDQEMLKRMLQGYVTSQSGRSRSGS